MSLPNRSITDPNFHQVSHVMPNQSAVSKGSKLQSPLMYAGGMISSTVNQMGRANQVGTASKVGKTKPAFYSQPGFKDEAMLISRHQQSPIRIQESELKVQPSNIKERTKEIMLKLTVPRLRKMQALVRGFLFRRKVYPKLLRQHMLCTAIFNKVRQKISNQVITEVVLEVLTFNKYNQNAPLYSVETVAIGSIVQDIIDKVVTSQSRQIVTSAIEAIASLLAPSLQAAHNAFLWKLHDPSELTVYHMLQRHTNQVKREIVQDAIFEMVQEIRLQNSLKETLVPSLIQNLSGQVIRETLDEYAVESLVEDTIDKMVEDGSRAVVQYQYTKAIKPLELKAQKQFDKDFMSLLIAQTILQFMVQLQQKQPEPLQADSEQELPEVQDKKSRGSI